MGVQNLKLEAEVFQFTPQIQFPGQTPVETKPDPSLLSQIASQLGQLTLTVGQLHQAVVGQTFTRQLERGQVGSVGGEIQSPNEEIRKLTQRIDELEARLPKVEQRGKAA
jgi:hypothetical protein